MIIPALITAGILGLLYVSRQESSATRAPAPTPPLPAPGLTAQIGDVVEVPISAVPGGRIGLPPSPFPGVVVTALHVRITNVQARIEGDIRGVITSYAYEGEGRSGSVSVPDGVSTPYFSRLYVRRVIRNGQVIA